MALERIGPTTRPLGPPDRPQQQPGPAARVPAGQELPLDVDFTVSPAGAGGAGAVGLLLDGADGLPNPQARMDAMAAALAADTPNAGDPAAMRPNQVFMSRQLVWQPPDTAMMAGSWQVMVRTYAEQRAAWLEQSSGQHMPSSLFMTDQTPNGLRDGRPTLPMVTEMEPWRFAVYAWGAEKLVLKVIVIDDEMERNRRRRARVALRLELMLPGVGRVVIQMEPTGGNGVVLEVGAAQTSAMQHMRELLPQLAANVSRCGLTIVRCRLRRELPASAGGENTYPNRQQAAQLSATLFKAMAELAVMLSQPLPPEDVFSQSA